MAKWLAALLIVLPILAAPWRGADPVDDIGLMLDDFHDAASEADGERYFAHFTSDAVFIGTASEERWDLEGNDPRALAVRRLLDRQRNALIVIGAMWVAAICAIMAGLRKGE